MKQNPKNNYSRNFFLKYPISFGLFFGFILSGANAIMNFILKIDQNTIGNTLIFFVVATLIGTSVAYFLRWKKER